MSMNYTVKNGTVYYMYILPKQKNLKPFDI